jgi:hypothetical protein
MQEIIKRLVKVLEKKIEEGLILLEATAPGNKQYEEIMRDVLSSINIINNPSQILGSNQAPQNNQPQNNPAQLIGIKYEEMEGE